MNDAEPMRSMVARETGGQFITAAQMRQGIEPLRLIREEFGDSMDVAMEFHGYWSLPCAIQIAQALEPYAPMWLEEMLPQDSWPPTPSWHALHDCRFA